MHQHVSFTSFTPNDSSFCVYPSSVPLACMCRPSVAMTSTSLCFDLPSSTKSDSCPSSSRLSKVEEVEMSCALPSNAGCQRKTQTLDADSPMQRGILHRCRRFRCLAFHMHSANALVSPQPADRKHVTSFAPHHRPLLRVLCLPCETVVLETRHEKQEVKKDADTASMPANLLTGTSCAKRGAKCFQVVA